MARCSLGGGTIELLHHVDELLEVNLAVAIFVNLTNDLVDGFLAEAVVTAKFENLADLVLGDAAGVVLVEHSEGSLQFLLRRNGVLVHGGNHELGVVDETTAVGVDGIEHSLDFLVGHDLSVVLEVSFLDLLDGEFTVSVLVEGLEDLGEVVAFALVKELGSDESEGSLLHGGVALEVAEVGEGLNSLGLLDLELSELNDPWVAESIGSAGSGALVEGEQLGDEILGVGADLLPDAVIEREVALTNLLHDLLIGLSVEGRHAGEKDVDEDTAGPDVALVVVALVKNLGGDVVRGAKLLVKWTVRVVDEGGSEINDLDLVELLVLLEKDVLGLEIAMDDVVLMAVVDAGEDLLHEHGGVTLAEFATVKDLIKELTTLADSKTIERRVKNEIKR